MAIIRIEPMKDEASGLYAVAIYNPHDAQSPFVTTEARYMTAAAAENDVIATIAANANRARSK